MPWMEAASIGVEVNSQTTTPDRFVSGKVIDNLKVWLQHELSFSIVPTGPIRSSRSKVSACTDAHWQSGRRRIKVFCTVEALQLCVGSRLFLIGTAPEYIYSTLLYR
ncbi:uncharacterized protein LACBIDRAFT_334640 [Laccaria bicolor S238N-H82]|uniref:Predicted protein n=1 Tax=Laccaria bicolor (strain S238N-H82 / ATCC MYA-4686) TaxID=486041 RepID=B0DZT4_LACBS|nr:uncharacterized protein LACBIDRAFT_334640 [Laccaria bicolor S238N-H82]EDQ99932.1 predicted protein [Laccaria bicolor S238N-H82]|eukprot:XP_001889475.1 predicted protein [Laccaria bicolor S238N-H82]